MGGAQRVKRVMPILQDSKVKMGFLHRLAAWASPKRFVRSNGSQNRSPMTEEI